MEDKGLAGPSLAWKDQPHEPIWPENNSPAAARARRMLEPIGRDAGNRQAVV